MVAEGSGTRAESSRSDWFRTCLTPGGHVDTHLATGVSAARRRGAGLGTRMMTEQRRLRCGDLAIWRSGDPAAASAASAAVTGGQRDDGAPTPGQEVQATCRSILSDSECHGQPGQARTRAPSCRLHEARHPRTVSRSTARGSLSVTIPLLSQSPATPKCTSARACAPFRMGRPSYSPRLSLCQRILRKRTAARGDNISPRDEHGPPPLNAIPFLPQPPAPPVSGSRIMVLSIHTHTVSSVIIGLH